MPSSPGTSLQGPLLSFSMIDAGRFDECRDFINDNPDMMHADLRESKNALLGEAVSAQRGGRPLYARACIQRAVILSECMELSDAGIRGYLEDLAEEVRGVTDSFYDNFDKAYNNVVERAGNCQPPTSSTADLSQDQSNTRHSTSARQTLPSVPEGEIEFKGTKGTEEKLDKRYKQRGDAKEFFAVGRVFALLWHENAGKNKNKKSQLGEPEFVNKGKYGEYIFSHIRRMVVVRQRHGYCWCIPINSYGGKGVAKKGMSKEEIEAHTIIYMATARPVRSSEETGIIKDPIAVETATNQTLDRFSRLNFAKIHTVEHNVKVMNVGIVCRAHMYRLEGYWKAELTRDA